jgi:hypothetical protein
MREYGAQMMDKLTLEPGVALAARLLLGGVM